MQRLFYVAWASVACIGIVMIGMDSWHTYQQREEYRLVIKRCAAAPEPQQRPATPKIGDPIHDRLNEQLDGLQNYQDAVSRGCALPSPNEEEANDRLGSNAIGALGLIFIPFALMLAIRFVYRGFAQKPI
ncbi:MAG: hypothetical protein U1D36_16180 [Hydrogenophaga sp.]|uniref:hypothetical protein n=1 Tax=Hydrogenophaga sp. TaxID=1904254 RepID=UPI00272EF78B|nr:hypothetical protein [Hydrogenophaga sp.]MDP2405059.1 hypothetical protein [Hydrogenophaga sp.]MDZ4175993.1 hypothetical protein [Hydrogenophaga sp.]